MKICCTFPTLRCRENSQRTDSFEKKTSTIHLLELQSRVTKDTACDQQVRF